MSDRAAAANSGQHRGVPVVVVGAGMAGLTCAVALHEAGQAVQVVEASDEVGGRIRTDRRPDGFVLDRGFQVVLTGYPVAKRWLSLDRLNLSAFDAGAWVWTGRRRVPLADPLRHPAALARDLTTSLFSVGDKLRLARFGLWTHFAGWETAAEAGDDISTEAELKRIGFGTGFIERFARPFWGGIMLDPALTTSARLFRFTTKMFLQGHAALPAAGIRAMPAQLLVRLPHGAVHLNRSVQEIVIEDGIATGVRVADEQLSAAAVVIATDPPAARRLTGLTAFPSEDDGAGSTTVYLAGSREPPTGARLVLDGTGSLAVNHLAPLSAVAPSYAPPGQHLVAAVVLGEAQAVPDDLLGERVRGEVARLLDHSPADWRVLQVTRLPFSQFAQPPGIFARLPATTTPVNRLFLASEATVDSSYNGAMLSGERAAAAVLSAIR